MLSQPAPRYCPPLFIQRLWIPLFIHVPSKRLEAYDAQVCLQRPYDALSNLLVGVAHEEGKTQPLSPQE